MELEQSEIDRFTKPHINRPQIQHILNFKPRNLDIYRQSLLHKSVLRLIKSLPSEYQVPKYMMESNERLEYLGDSVISMVTADYLYRKYPKEEEYEDLDRFPNVVLVDLILAEIRCVNLTS